MPRKPPRAFEPLVETWDADRPLFRVHHVLHSASEPYATERPARFRPLHAAGGEVVPMLYAGETPESAIAESILHDIAPRGPRVVAFESLLPTGLACLVPERDLRLAKLHSD